VDVNVTNGVVTLAGEVPNAQVKAEAEQEAQSVSGVTRVINNLQVKAPPSRSSVTRPDAEPEVGSSGWACVTQVAPSSPFACPSNVGIGSIGLLYARHALPPDHVPLAWSKAVTVGWYSSHSSMN
jgi:hypothetical protein